MLEVKGQQATSAGCGVPIAGEAPVVAGTRATVAREDRCVLPVGLAPQIGKVGHLGPRCMISRAQNATARKMQAKNDDRLNREPFHRHIGARVVTRLGVTVARLTRDFAMGKPYAGGRCGSIREQCVNVAHALDTIYTVTSNPLRCSRLAGGQRGVPGSRAGTARRRNPPVRCGGASKRRIGPVSRRRELNTRRGLPISRGRTTSYSPTAGEATRVICGARSRDRRVGAPQQRRGNWRNTAPSIGASLHYTCVE